MNKLLVIVCVTILGLVSCDKVENLYPVDVSSGLLDWSLYPDGDSTHYVDVANAWPTFTTNTTTDRNVLIEDFTGHKCNYCPPAAAEAEQLEGANPGRVYSAGIHTGAVGYGEQQEFIPGTIYDHDFTNTQGLDIGVYFGSDWPSSPFEGNPHGAVSRMDHGSSAPVTHPSNWANATNSIIAANDHKVNIQAVVNYYPSTQGVFLHTEVDVIDASLTNQLRTVVYLIEDSIQKPQLFLAPIDDSLTYIHHNVMRECIDGRAFGQELDADHLDASTDNYYFNYSYQLPSQYAADNVHLLIYVRDAVTEEIYQVIEAHLQ